jgi:hypothetical protein
MHHLFLRRVEEHIDTLKAKLPKPPLSLEWSEKHHTPPNQYGALFTLMRVKCLEGL